MSEVKLTVGAPKEVVDVLLALDALVAKVVAKESVVQIAAEELPVLFTLFSELSPAVSEVTAESDEVIDAAELIVRRTVYRLLGKPVTPITVG